MPCDLETDCLCTPAQAPTCEWRSRDVVAEDDDGLAGPVPLWLTLTLALVGTLVVAALVLAALLIFLKLTGWPR